MKLFGKHTFFYPLLTGLSLALIYSCNFGHPEATQAYSVEPIPVNLRLEKASVFLTAKDTDYRLSKIAEPNFTTFVQPDEHFPTLIIDAQKQFQTIVGFGGALTDASAETFYKLSKDKQEEILKAYFDPIEGIGYTLCRTHINSCDFSSVSYAYSEVENDVDLKYFSIDRDKQYRIPFIQAAMKVSDNSLNFFASPWSPPAWMKTNNNMLQGGKLKPEYYQIWANYFVRFFEEYQTMGIPMWGLTVQNEPMAVQPWESCIFTAEEEKDFVKNYLGSTLEKAGMGDKKIIIWDHNRGIMYQRAMVAFNDPEASKYIWGTGFHWYTGNHFANVKLVQEAFPDKKVLFTEGCVFPFDYTKLNEWSWGEQYGESILHDLNNSTVGWVDWNILLDETGGPNHVANFCYAPLIGNTQTNEIIYMNSYFYMGHFSKFIKPGAKRIVCSSNYDKLLATAMINIDGSLAVVALNLTEEQIDYKIYVNNKGIDLSLPAHAISTITFN
ncbi:MAG: glycoside hydrolase family 30 protein [Bacteroidota bacterium]|nr:MAG: glycoside hydrolase family 30 protein [Bacteroidota bacterium]